MASIAKYPILRHLRAETNQHILLYSGGRLVRQGAGISFWFNPLSAAVAQVPQEDIEITFLLRERSSDYQEVVAQCTLIYRIANHAQAASRLNFSISLDNGVWLEPPLERLASFWSQRAQKPARDYIVRVPLVDALRNGAEAIRSAVSEALKADPELEAMGLAVVSVQVVQILPSADLEKALQTPTREEIQQKADEAVFQRRALAVEKERAIKENELRTEIELARQQEDLILRQGQNRLLGVQQEAESEKVRVGAELERLALIAEAQSQEEKLRALASAEALRTKSQAQAEAEAARVEIYRGAPPQVALGLALQEFAGKIQNIQHLNISPDLLGSSLQQFLRDQAGE